MKTLAVVGTIAVGLCQIAYTEELSCDALSRAGTESITDYFEDVEGAGPIDEGYLEQLVRKSVAAFHHASYLPSLSLKETDELGEGVSVSNVKGKNGKAYVSVNVGFGGGNSATYYYLPNSLILLPVMSYDGDCVGQGESEEFPIEQHVSVERRAGLVCSFGEDAPFKQVNVQVPLGHDGLMFTSAATLVLAEPNALVRRLEIEARGAQKASVAYLKKSETLSFHSEVKAKKGPTDWKVTVSGRLGEKDPLLFGRAYPLILGGYHSSQARDYSVHGSCIGSLGIKKVEFHRVINF